MVAIVASRGPVGELGLLGRIMNEPFVDIKAAMEAVDAYAGSVGDFVLPIADVLQDPMGMHMALITDRILAKGWEPDGFEQRSGYRLYRYKEME